MRNLTEQKPAQTNS